MSQPEDSGGTYEVMRARQRESDALRRQMRRSVDVGAIFEPRVAVTITMAATKANDLGFVVETHGEPSDEQIIRALAAAGDAATRAMELVGDLERKREERPGYRGDK